MQSVRDPIRRRQPIERPLDIIGLELLVTISQALLAGILLSLASQLGGDARAYGLPLPGLLAVLAIAVGVGWLRWLVGGSGWLMAAVCLATAILTGALWLLALQDPTLPRVDWLVGLIAALCAIYGLAAGVFLDGPHRAHWKGGVSQPRRGVPETRATPARFSPPVQRVVDERLTNLRLPQVSLPSAPRVSMAGMRRSARRGERPQEPAADGLTLAEAVPPQAPAPMETEPTPPAPPTAPGPVATTPTPAMDQEMSPTDATEVVAATTGDTAPEEPDVVSEAMPADPDAPTQPVAPPASEWPRPIEPRGRTGAHKADPDT
jgi:hypothetical protein